MNTQIGRYVIETELGRGGFGRVYRAFDPTVGRHVAIKTLNADNDEEMLVRFRNEAGAAGRLRHKNIVTIYDFGEAKGEPFIVMELLEGRDLQHLIGSGAAKSLPLIDKMRIMNEVADGLQHAHRYGVVHRDIKPANIMVMPDRSVKIMDFGIAFMSQAATRLTKSGMIPGTLRYMSPEQFQGAQPDPLSDVFAFGVTYYEFLTSLHPFDAPTTPAVMFRIVSSKPDPITNYALDCPAALEQILLRALHKERDQRYQTVEDMQLDLRAVLIDLERGQARQLIAGAQQAAAAGNAEEAQTLLRRILQLDPSNAEAVALRRALQSGRHSVSAMSQVSEVAVPPRVEMADPDAATTMLRPAVQTPVAEPAAKSHRWWLLAAGALAVAGGGGYVAMRPTPTVIERPSPAVAVPEAKPVPQERKESHPVPVQANPDPVPVAAVKPDPPSQKATQTPQNPQPVTPAPVTKPADPPKRSEQNPPPKTEPVPRPAEPSADEARWAALNKKDVIALHDFVARFPGTKHNAEAQQLINQLETEAREAEKLRRSQAEAKEAEKLRRLQAETAAKAAEEAKRGEVLRAERNAIYAALSRYTTAFEQRDLKALQGAWPEIPSGSLDGLKRAFADKNVRMSMSLQPLADPEIRDNAATLQAQLSTITIQKGRPSNSPGRRVTIILQKKNTTWLIQDIQN